MVKRILGSYKRRLLNLVERPAIVLLYHRVTQLTKDPQLLSVTPENFYAQINRLKKRYNLLRIDEFSEMIIRKKRFPKNSVIITFDDGYADNLLEALPILESLKAQALFYITTSKLGTNKELWWDELDRVLFDNNNLPSMVKINHRNSLLQFRLESPQEIEKAYGSLHPLLKYSPPSQRDQIVDQLQKATNAGTIGRKTHRVLTEIELTTLSLSQSAVIGAHTHNHPALSVLTYKDQFEEIKTSRDLLENLLNKKMEHFSYPYGGKRDYNNDSINACRELEFKMVCSNHYGQVHSWTNPYRIPRILIRNWEEKIFDENLLNSFKY